MPSGHIRLFYELYGNVYPSGCQWGDALVKTNALAAQMDGTSTCAARHVVETFKQLRMAPTAPASAAAASSSV
jgi:hypothetical protein